MLLREISALERSFSVQISTGKNFLHQNSNESPRPMPKRNWTEVPTTDAILQVPLSREGTLRLRAKANRAGCPPGQPVRQGIDWLAGIADKDPKLALDHAREPSPLYAESHIGREDEKPSTALALRPARMMELIEAARVVGDAAEQEVQEKGLPLWKECFGLSAKPGGRQPSLITRLVQVGARWAIESLQVENVRTNRASSGRGGQLFEKPPGEDRGGRRVPIYITKSAKRKIAARAGQFDWSASKLARLALHDLIDFIERCPMEALSYVEEEREYYQPPNRGNEYHYAYQIVVGLETKKLIECAPEILKRAAKKNAPGQSEGEDPTGTGDVSGRNSSEGSQQYVLTQKRVMQAAGRWAIESEDIGVPLLGGSSPT